MGEHWESDRARKEREANDRVKAFDRLVDMALDGWQNITMQQAIEAYKEEQGIHDDQPTPAA